MLALAIVTILVAIRNPGVWNYLLRRPGSVDEKSIGLWIEYGLWPLLLAVLAWAICLGLGRRALRALKAGPAGALDGVAAAALGLALLGEAVFLFMWGGAPKTVLFLLFAAAAALGLTPLWRPALIPAAEGWSAAAAGLVAFAVFHVLVVALAPPTGWDVRAYHLALPELYLRSGGLVEVPWLLHSHWPHLMEVLYTLPLAAGRDGAAALIHAGACAVLAGGTFLAGGWPAVLILSGQPALLRTGPTAHADGGCALLVFASALALARWEESKKNGWLCAAGYLAGSAAAAKLFGAAGAASWVIYLVWRHRRAREAVIFAASAAVAIGPWLLRTWINTGDPIWPLLRLTPAAADLAARNARTNIWNWPPPHWLATHDGPIFLLAPLIGLALLSYKAAKRPSRLEIWLWIPVPLLALLAFRHHEGWRFMIPMYAAAAITSSRFASASFAAGGFRRGAAAALILLGASPILGLTQNNELFAVLGLRSSANPSASPRTLFEDLSIDTASFYREAANELPPGSKVLLFREVRGYRTKFEYLWGDPLNQNLIEYRRLKDFDDLYARLKELGVTHVLDHEGSHLYRPDPLYYDARTMDLMSGMLKRKARRKLVREGLSLHQLL